jgi:cytochrome c oxidase cbb3-type subunit 2
MRRTALVPIAIALLAIAPAAARADEPAPPRGPSGVDGRKVFLRHCAPCHGWRGDGEGPAARHLPVRPRDFTAGAYRFRTTPSGTPPTDDDLVRTIQRGIPGTPMPSWKGVLSEPEIRAVVAILRTFAPPDLPAPKASDSVKIPAAPAETASGTQRGRNVFLLMRCWQCHGLGGKGDGASNATLTDDKGNPIRALNFTKGYLKGGGRPEDVYRTLLTGLDGSPMPSFGDALVLTRDSFQDLSAMAPVLPQEELKEVEGFVATLPTQESFDKLTDAQREVVQAGWRWDLVFYVRSLTRRNAVASWLFDDPYVTR